MLIKFQFQYIMLTAKGNLWNSVVSPHIHHRLSRNRTVSSFYSWAVWHHWRYFVITPKLLKWMEALWPLDLLPSLPASFYYLLCFCSFCTISLLILWNTWWSHFKCLCNPPTGECCSFNLPHDRLDESFCTWIIPVWALQSARLCSSLPFKSQLWLSQFKSDISAPGCSRQPL